MSEAHAKRGGFAGRSAPDDVKERLTELCSKHNVPGAVVGVWSDGDVDVAATGVCSTTNGIEVTPDTIFQIGSITKVWTATLVMQLVDEGVVDLDAPVRKYLPHLMLSDDATSDLVTIRHLLTHTSGIGDFDFGMFGRGDDCVERFVDALAERPMLHEPGRFLSYCNSGVIVLGRLLEVMRDATWDDVLRERLIRPLGLDHTFTLAEEAIVHRVAVGHPDEEEGEPAPGTEWGIPRAAGPAGLILSTAQDTLEFAAMHIDDGRDVLSSSSVRAMREVQPVGPGVRDDPRGLGWYLYRWGEETVVGHDGGTFGQLSFLRVVPARRFAAVLLTNSWGGALVHVDLFGELFRDRLGIEIPPLPSAPVDRIDVDPEPYAGEWVWQGLHVRLTDESTGLVAKLVVPGEDVDIPPIPMTALGDDRFLVRVPPLGLDSICTFLERDGDGRFAFADLRGRLMVRSQ